MHLGPLKHYHNPLSLLRLPVYTLQTSDGAKQDGRARESGDHRSVCLFFVSFFICASVFSTSTRGRTSWHLSSRKRQVFSFVSVSFSGDIFLSAFSFRSAAVLRIFSHFLKRYREATTLRNILELFVFNPFVWKLSFIQCLSFFFSTATCSFV